MKKFLIYAVAVLCLYSFLFVQPIFAENCGCAGNLNLPQSESSKKISDLLAQRQNKDPSPQTTKERWTLTGEGWGTWTDDGRLMLSTDEGWIAWTDDEILMLSTDEGWVSWTDDEILVFWSEEKQAWIPWRGSDSAGSENKPPVNKPNVKRPDVNGTTVNGTPATEPPVSKLPATGPPVTGPPVSKSPVNRGNF